MMKIRPGICGVLAMCLGGCGGNASKPVPRQLAGSPASSFHPAEPAAGSGSDTASTSTPTGTNPDAGAFPSVTKPQAGQPLQAHVQVNGATTTCGTCAVLIAQVQGGTQPYAYAWSDPKLQGPGPHQVCPDQPTDYTVTVTDSSAAVNTPEFSSQVQTVQAAGKVDCRARTPDASVVDFEGCITTDGTAPMMMATDPLDAGVDAGDAAQAITCETGDGGYYSGTGMLPMPMLAGHTYNLSYDQLIPIVIGEPVVIDVYGSNKPCELEEKLTTWTIDGTWHHPGCFTPTKNYDYVLIRVYVGVTLFYFNLLAGATFCAGCAEPPP